MLYNLISTKSILEYIADVIDEHFSSTRVDMVCEFDTLVVEFVVNAPQMPDHLYNRIIIKANGSDIEASTYEGYAVCHRDDGYDIEYRPDYFYRIANIDELGTILAVNNIIKYIRIQYLG